MPRLLLVGDFATDPRGLGKTGFGRVLEALAPRFRALGWDVAALAIGYSGDPHPLQAHHTIYSVRLGRDAYGVSRIREVIAREQPDVVLMLQDPWVVALYMDELVKIPKNERPVTIAYLPVDGTGLNALPLRVLSLCDSIVAYTEFGRNELLAAFARGFVTHAYVHVIGHGVDRTVFTPRPQADARADLGLPLTDRIVLVIDRYDTRKRLDLAFESFSLYAVSKPTSKLWYHGAVIHNGKDIRHLAWHYGIGSNQLLLTAQMLYARPGEGIPDEHVALIYQASDVRISTSLGEGWGLPALEAMACGLPQVLPDFGGTPSWANHTGAAWVPTSAFQMLHNGSTMGRAVSAWEMVRVMSVVDQPSVYESIQEEALALAAQPRFDWNVIAQRFDAVIYEAMQRRGAAKEAISSDTQR